MLILALTDPLDAYEKTVSAVGIETCKTRITTCAIDVYMIIEVVRSTVYIVSNIDSLLNYMGGGLLQLVSEI